MTLESFKYGLISLYTCAVRVYCQVIIIILESIHFVLQNFGLIFIYICSLTLLVFEIVLRTFLLSFDWLVPTGEQFSRPCRSLNISIHHDTPLPPNTILATIDVKSLYTNIPHDEGINAVLEALDTIHGRMWPLRKVIHQFLEYILKENYFTFMDKLYLQKHGTAMGTKMAPSFANIFMGALEQTLLSSSPNHLIPLLWKRFIDDIFLIWTHGEESFRSFIQHLNSFHPTIKFEVTHSTQSVNFLDTTVYVTPQNTLHTTLYTKPTDRMPLLHQASHHPNTCKKGLIYSQMLRYRRIITDDKEFQQKAQNLRVALIGRGYKDKDILPHIDRASTYTQSQLLSNTPATNKPCTLPFIIPYNPDLSPLPHILKQHWQYIENDPVLSQIWPNQPVMAYQRHKNLKEHFVRTKFTKPPSHQQHTTP